MTVCFLGCGVESTPDTELRDAHIMLDNGNELVFVNEAEGEVSIIEISNSPNSDGIIDAMVEQSATPAELWIALSDDTEVPDFLMDHHEANVVRDLHLDLDVPARELSFRGWAHQPEWGGTADYCEGGFLTDFASFNPELTSVNMTGMTGSPVEGYSAGEVKQAWVAVCNDTSLDDNTTISSVAIARLSGTTWVNMNCSGVSSGSWCLSITNQTAKAFHFWTTTAMSLRFSGKWGGGVSHLTTLLAGYTTDAY